MTSMESIKVYELAKELGLDSLSLLDRLKTLKIEVKNHMSDLTQEQAGVARTAVLKPAGKSASSDSKKKSTTGTVRKKAAASPEKSTEKAADRPTEKKAEKKPEKKSSATSAPATVSDPISASTSSPIIRRRVRSDGATETTTTTHMSMSQPQTGKQSDTEFEAGTHAESVHSDFYHEVGSTESTSQEEVGSTETMVQFVSDLDSQTPAVEITPPAHRESSVLKTSPSINIASEAPTVSVSQPTSTSVSQPTSPLPNQPVSQSPSMAASVAQNITHASPQFTPAEPATHASTPIAPSPDLNKTTNSLGVVRAVTTTVRPIVKSSMLRTVTADDTPRKSLLRVVQMPSNTTTPGRTSISRPTPNRPGAPGGVNRDGPGVNRGTPPTDKDGFRVFKVSKESLDKMVEEDSKQKKGPKSGEIRPEDVKFGDYRKKEMVFLPKKKKIPVGKSLNQTQLTTPKAQKRIVEMHATISVQEFAAQMGIKASDVIRKLMTMGQMATINQALDFDTATLVGQDFGFEVRNITFNEENYLPAIDTDPAHLEKRPPVVTIMGHVDHGKTTLLDSIREANVAAKEAGGITQHIGAYTINKDGNLITFIDTPGHEAFTSMRARGANTTDIVILVVSADDGVMPQTREALSHAQAAKVPIIVAVNKIDKPGANPEKIKQGLAELNLLAEDWGGETIFVPVSALQKTNLDKLLESILLVAEVQDLKANPKSRTTGMILEARLDRGRGPVVTVLVKSGTLKLGDPVVIGTHYGKVRALTNHLGKPIKELKPGMAAEILGMESVPSAGDIMDIPNDETAARRIIEFRLDQARAASAKKPEAMTMDSLFAKINTGGMKEAKVLVKADVFGSAEAVKESLEKLSNPKIKVNVIHTATGGITESDVLLASASKAIIIGFNVRPETKAQQLATAEHIEIKSYSIIYELIEDMKKAMVGMLDKKKVEKYLGRAEIRQTFSIPKLGTIAGCSVVDGKIFRNANIRLLRDSKIVYQGKLNSLKRFKDDAKEVAQGFECGMGIENYNDLKVGDLIEAYQIDMVEQQLE